MTKPCITCDSPGYCKLRGCPSPPPSCGDCVYYDNKGHTRGYCIRNAPVVGADHISAQFPIVSSGMWCGEFKREQ